MDDPSDIDLVAAFGPGGIDPADPTPEVEAALAATCKARLAEERRGWTLEDLVAALGLDDEDDEVLDLVDWLLQDDERVALLGDGRLADRRLLVEGCTAHHRLTAEEIADGRVAAAVDLQLLSLYAAPRTVDGDLLHFALDPSDDDPDRASLALPAGMLADAAPGDLLRATFVDDAVALAVVPDPGLPTDTDLGALAQLAVARLDEAARCPDGGDHTHDVELPQLAIGLALDEPSVWQSPVPFSEVLAAAGITVVDDIALPPGADVAAWRAERELEELDPFEELAVEELELLAALRSAARAETIPPQAVLARIDAALAEPVVAESASLALVDLHGRSAPGLATVLDAIAAAPGSTSAGTWWLRSVVADMLDDEAGRRDALRRALGADPRFGPACGDHAADLEDAGDLRAAIATLRRAGLDDPATIQRLQDLQVQPYPGVGRNDPCPCGSGRKHKRCHGGGDGIVPVGERVSELLSGLLVRATAPVRWRLCEERLGPAATMADPAHAVHGHFSPLIACLLLFDGGLLAEVLDRRGDLLPAADRELATRWADTRAELVTVVEADVALSLADRTGAVVPDLHPHLPTVLDDAAPGDHGVVFLIDLPDGTRLPALGLHRIPDALVDDVAGLLEEGDTIGLANLALDLEHDDR